MHTLLKQRRLRWPGLVSRMEDDGVPEETFSTGEVATGKRPAGRPQLRFKDVCKHDLKAVAINTDTLEALACDRCGWKQKMQEGLPSYEDTLMQQAEERRARRKSRPQTDRPASTFLALM